MNTQLTSYPRDELEQLPSYCERLCDERMSQQTEALSKRCASALHGLRSNQQRLVDAQRMLVEKVIESETVTTKQDANTSLVTLAGSDNDATITPSMFSICICVCVE